MNDTKWAWAKLSGDKLTALEEAEQTLGAGVDILMAYQQSDRGFVSSENFSNGKLQIAPINDSQVECLQGLEKHLQAVVIAYSKGS
jgi:hypothetical protein